MNNWSDVCLDQLRGWIEENVRSSDEVFQLKYLVENHQPETETELGDYVLHRKGNKLSIRGPKDSISIGGDQWIRRFDSELDVLIEKQVA